MDQLQDRADIPIWNAIEARNYKQALKLVDKRLSKKPTDYLEALKIYIRSFSAAISEKTAVLLHLEDLVQQKKPLADLTAIDLYDDALEQVLGTQADWARIIGELRWQFVKAIPKSEETSVKCFKACLAKKDLDHARQIANSLEKSFPSNRNYVFWNLSSMFLYSKSQDYPASQTKLWGSLAFAQISKLATVTRQGKSGDQLPARSIQTPQELLLLHLITGTYGKLEQQLDYLEDPKLGPESSVSKGEWEIWRMRLRMMQDARRWDDLFKLTANLLERSRTKDKSGQLAEAPLSDWVVWEAFIKSAFELGDHSCESKVRAEVEAHLDPTSGIDKSWRRNASLAWVKLAFEGLEAFSPSDFASPSAKVDTIMKYLDDYGDATTAYSDMRPFAEKLSKLERGQLLALLNLENVVGNKNSGLSSAKLITKATNRFKLKYLLTCSLPESERRNSPKPIAEDVCYNCTSCSKSSGQFCSTCLASEAKNYLQAYKSALDDNGEITKHLLTTDRHPADDICVLSATCLIKLGLIDTIKSAEPLTTSRSRYFLQAAALLEKAWLHSKSNFQISLMLVRLYTVLGCGSLALRAYNRLALKQIQLDTLSYVMFDRISSFHPREFASHDAETINDRSPILCLSRQQKVYRDAYEQIAKNVYLGFKHGSYNAMYQIWDVEKELRRGLGAAMSVIEGKRCARLTVTTNSCDADSNGLDLLADHPEAPGTVFVDNLDYKSFPNYESTLGPSLERLSRVAPPPSAHRYSTSLFQEKLLLIMSPSTSSGEQEMLRVWLKQHLESLGTAKVGDRAALTGPEDLARQAYLNMALIIHNSHDRSQWTDPDYTSRLAAHNKDLSSSLAQILDLVDELQALVPAYFDTLHTLYTAHDVGKAATALIVYLGKQGKGTHESQAGFEKELSEAARGLLAAIEKQCSVVKKGMDEGWIDKVLECALAEGTLLDENDEFMEEWAGLVVESWRESVVGLSHLKGP